MTHKAFVLAIALFVFPVIVIADSNTDLQKEIHALQQQTLQLQAQLNRLQKQVVSQPLIKKSKKNMKIHSIIF